MELWVIAYENIRVSVCLYVIACAWLIVGMWVGVIVVVYMRQIMRL